MHQPQDLTGIIDIWRAEEDTANLDGGDATISLKPHQLIPVEFLKNHRGLLIFHSTGSGKTLTALYGVYQLPYKIIIVGPKSSKKAFQDNIKKAGFDSDRAIFYTYTKAKKIVETDINFFYDASVILDEAHSIRTENINNLYLASALSVAKRIVLLTATPVINYLNDLAVLVNIVKGDDILPTDRELFDQMYRDSETNTLRNEDLLMTKLSHAISYHSERESRSNMDAYPRSREEYLEVEMNHDQIEEYAYYIKKVIYEDRDIIDRSKVLEIDYALLPAKKRNYFLNVTRQLSNIAKISETSPKLEAIMAKILEGPYPIVVYSNYLKYGIYNVAVALEKLGIPYKSITGYTTNEKINLIVNNYNQGLYKVLLLSMAGSESLDLKGTRQFHVMEPHWNDPRIDQAIGRAIRYLSHQDLPPQERLVTIYRWISVFPRRIRNLSADQYLRALSESKTALWKLFLGLVKQVSIENSQ